MDYIENLRYEQLPLLFEQVASVQEYLLIPSSLTGFHNTDTTSEFLPNGRNSLCMNGTLSLPEERTCPFCGKSHLHINQRFARTLKHLPVGNGTSIVSFQNVQYLCMDCRRTHMQEIPFKSVHHSITKELEDYICFLLARHSLTNKEISELTGVGPNIVKAIDKRRLEGLYVVDGKLRRPETYARFLGIDEFKLHNGHKYATHIIDMKTGHILWISEGKKKQVVYDFIEHVGLEWMSHVEAVALDMNSDFQEAFLEKCPHLRVVFDYFHIFKNFETPGGCRGLRGSKKSETQQAYPDVQPRDFGEEGSRSKRGESPPQGKQALPHAGSQAARHRIYETLRKHPRKEPAAVRDGSHQGDAARSVFVSIGAPYAGIRQPHHGSLLGVCARRR